MSKRQLLWCANAVVILNLLDAILTLCYTSLGVATESNPMMEGVLARSPIAFMMAKLALVSLCILLLWRLGSRTLAMVGMAGATATYLIILGYHISAIPRLVAQL